MAFDKNSNEGPKLPENFDVNRPMRGAKDGYMWRWFDLDRDYSRIISNMADKRYDQRIPRLTRHMISTVVDDNIRLYLFNLYDKTMNNIQNDPELGTEQKKADAIMDACDWFIGEIWAFYDQFTGVTHRLRVGNAKGPDETKSEIIEASDEVAGTIESPVGVPGREDIVYIDE
jgi:hypothetical protein